MYIGHPRVHHSHHNSGFLVQLLQIYQNSEFMDRYMIKIEIKTVFLLEKVWEFKLTTDLLTGE